MEKVTFDKEAKNDCVKEDIEWLRIWCEDTNVTNIPRVALIGDSITEGYYQFVKEELQGIAKVDCLTTSYSIASEIYGNIIKWFVKDSEYDVVHFNYGLHAYSVNGEIYESRCREMVETFLKKSKVILATTTTVLDETLQRENESWKEKVIERNEKIVRVSEEFDLEIDDLYKKCVEFGEKERYKDGVHFYEKLAKSVVDSVKKQLNL